MPDLPRTLRLLWNASGKWSAAWFALLLVQGALPAVAVSASKNLVNHLLAGSVTPAMICAAFIGSVLLLAECCRAAARWIQNIQADLLQDHISAQIHQKSIRAEMAFYDSADYYDHLHRAREEAPFRSVALLESAGSLWQNGITLVAMAAILLPFGWGMPLVLFLSTLPALLVVIRTGLSEYKWITETTAERRRARYYEWLITERETAAEMRLFGLGKYFASAYQGLRAGLRTKRSRMLKHRGLLELAAAAAALAMNAAMLVWMAKRVLQGHLNAGDLVLFYQALNLGQSLMRTLLHTVGKIYSNSLFLGNLFQFLDLKPQSEMMAGVLPAPEFLSEGIRFNGVSFCYPGSRRPALDGLDIFFQAGKMTAVVGPNGSGKSTLLKLLCRFYDPQKGLITLDGTDLRLFENGSLRRRITVLFQNPVQYHATLAENIAFGSFQTTPAAEEIEAAARAAGAEGIIAKLPDGYATVLGNRFSGGVDLSAGEWQRLALARAFLRQAPIILLDEPTSSMDAWAEAQWFENFHALACGRTVLLITHRFTTAMRADRIHVLDAGRVVDSGSHEELLAKNGMYATAWTAQTCGLAPVP